MKVTLKSCGVKLAAKVNYYFAQGRLTKYVVDGYVAFDDEEYAKIPKKKQGRPIKRR